MDVELQTGYIDNLKKIDKKNHLEYLIFCALDGEKVKEIGWERTVSANQIGSILLAYMDQNDLSLRVQDGSLVFTQNAQ